MEKNALESVKAGPSLRELIAKGELERAKEIYSVTDEDIKFINDEMSPEERSFHSLKPSFVG